MFKKQFVNQKEEIRFLTTTTILMTICLMVVFLSSGLHSTLYFIMQSLFLLYLASLLFYFLKKDETVYGKQEKLFNMPTLNLKKQKQEEISINELKPEKDGAYYIDGFKIVGDKNAEGFL